MRKRYQIKEMLRDSATRRRMINEAVDFICKMERIRDSKEVNDMQLGWAKELRQDDYVFWNDPDHGKGSRIYLIQNIRVIGKRAFITDYDESVLECPVSELS